jgi:hypothetical protein
MRFKWNLVTVATLCAILGMSPLPAANGAPSINISNISLAKNSVLVSEEITVSFNVVSTNGTRSVSGQINAPGGGFSGSLGQLVSGTDKDGTYKITFKLASYSESGNYRIDLYAVSNENLVASASGGIVNVTGSSSAKPSIVISEVKQINSFALVGGQFEVTLRVVSTNGTRSVSGQINAPSGGFWGSIGQLVNGTDKDGTYKIIFTLASFAEIGIYRIDLYAVSAESLVSSASGGNFLVHASLATKAAADKAAADKAAADKAAADKAAADKAAAVKAAGEARIAAANKKYSALSSEIDRLLEQYPSKKSEIELYKKKLALFERIDQVNVATVELNLAGIESKLVAMSSIYGKVARTITCTKGKQTKKVTDVSPKCPSGYKVKR